MQPSCAPVVRKLSLHFPIQSLSSHTGTARTTLRTTPLVRRRCTRRCAQQRSILRTASGDFGAGTHALERNSVPKGVRATCVSIRCDQRPFLIYQLLPAMPRTSSEPPLALQIRLLLGSRPGCSPNAGPRSTWTSLLRCCAHAPSPPKEISATGLRT